MVINAEDTKFEMQKLQAMRECNTILRNIAQTMQNISTTLQRIEMKSK